MTWRRQLPAYSPLSPGALVSGIGAALAGGESARAAVEAWLRERFHPDALLLTDSGTSALALAMRAAVLRSPDAPVMLPAYGCYDLVTAAMGAGVSVRWYDMEPGTLQPDWDSLRQGLDAEPAPAALVVVHHYGIPVDVPRVREVLASSHPVPLLIEDAAQGIGGSLEGEPLGALGDFGILSFGRGKGVTGGGGGALLVHSDPARALFDDLPQLSGRRSGLGSLPASVAQWALGRPGLYRLPASLPFLQLGETVFRAPHGPTPMSAASAGLLRRALEGVDQESEARKRHAGRLQEAGGELSIRAVGGSPGYLRFPVLLPESTSRDPALTALGVMPGYPVQLPLLQPSPYQGRALPGAETLIRRLMTFPVHSRVTEKDMVALIAALVALTGK